MGHEALSPDIAGGQILSTGFADGEDGYMTIHTYRGVWLSDRPLYVGDGVDGPDLLVVDIPEGVVADYEWEEDMKPHREYLVPANIVNSYPVERVVDDDLLRGNEFRLID